MNYRTTQQSAFDGVRATWSTPLRSRVELSENGAGVARLYSMDGVIPRMISMRTPEHVSSRGIFARVPALRVPPFGRVFPDIPRIATGRYALSR